VLLKTGWKARKTGISDAIFVPGGLGPMADLATDAGVKAAVARAWDGRLFTGQNPASGGPLAEEIVKALRGM